MILVFRVLLPSQLTVAPLTSSSRVSANPHRTPQPSGRSTHCSANSRRSNATAVAPSGELTLMQKDIITAARGAWNSEQTDVSCCCFAAAAAAAAAGSG